MLNKVSQYHSKKRKHRQLKSWASPRVLQDAQGRHFGYSFKEMINQSYWKVGALKPSCTSVWNLQKASKMAHEFSNELRTSFIQENQFEIWWCWKLLSRDTSTRSKVFQICPVWFVHRYRSISHKLPEKSSLSSPPQAVSLKWPRAEAACYLNHLLPYHVHMKYFSANASHFHCTIAEGPHFKHMYQWSLSVVSRRDDIPACTLLWNGVCRDK